ncbi:hypothetical protein D3C87_987840 [compost metagenome]
MARPWFRASPPAAARKAVSCFALLLLAGCSQAPLDVPASLGSLSGRARLEGVYTDQSGITLRLSGPGGEHIVRTDAKGMFAFSEIPAGTYSLSASRERYFPETRAEVTVAPAATTPPLVLRNHRPLVALAGVYDASRLKEAEDPEFGGTVPTQSPFLTNLSLSPDGQRLGFIQGGAIRSVRLDGTDLREERALPAGSQADWLDWGRQGFLLRSWSEGASASVTLLGPQGAQALVAASQDDVFAPVFSPDETQVAYVRYEPQSQSPQLMRIAASGGSPVQVMDMLDRLNLRGIWTGTYGMMFAPLEWRPEGLMFHAPMTCNLERGNLTLGKDGIYVLRDPMAPDQADSLHKAHFYSYYAHAFSHDGQRMLYGYGPQLRSKRLDDPVVTAPGDTVGHHSDEIYESLIPAPDGERLFYLTPSGIEVMLLLR